MRTIELDGQPFVLHDDGECLSDYIVREQNYFEPDILSFIRDRYPVHNIILDVGANIGNHSVYFARHLEYQAIIAFEPVVENYDLLRQNVREFDRVFTRNVAVGEDDRTVRIFLDPGNMGACEIRPNEMGRGIQQIRLDDIFVSPVTLLKIDVEWYEPQVLAGAKNLIEEDRPLILIEDVKKEYRQLLPEYYKLIQGWEHHNTYLYGAK